MYIIDGGLRVAVFCGGGFEEVEYLLNIM